MSMSTEQALACMHPEVDETPAKETETAVETPSVETPAEESKSEKDAASPEDKADNKANDGVEPKSEETKVSDETKVTKDDKVKDKAEDDKRSQRDYAFIREKNKRKQQKAKYEARIKELEEELKKRDGLEAKHFQKADGSADPEAYIRNEFSKRDMQDELKRIREQDQYEQQQMDIEQDRIITEHCFEGKDLEDYRNLIQSKGPAFAEALQENDPNSVVLSYLDTLQEYPIVLRELMTNMDTLRRLFRSKDPDALKYNVRVIADEILEKHHAPKVETPKVETPAVETPAPAAKPTIPVIGKQISSQGNSSSSGSLLKDYSSINHYLATHKYR